MAFQFAATGLGLYTEMSAVHEHISICLVDIYRVFCWKKEFVKLNILSGYLGSNDEIYVSGYVKVPLGHCMKFDELELHLQSYLTIHSLGYLTGCYMLNI